jgi:hypothetical protein
LEREPWCRFHAEQGVRVRATEVDHILAKRDGGTDDRGNLRSLCKPCHSRRTAVDQSGWGPAGVGVGGYKAANRSPKTAPSHIARPDEILTPSGAS